MANYVLGNLTSYELASVKRTNKSVALDIKKRDRLAAQITKLADELDEVLNRIELFEQPIKALTGGFTSEQVLNGEYVASLEKAKEVESYSQAEHDELTTEETRPDYEPPVVYDINLDADGSPINIDFTDLSNPLL
jgi:hypothetical protein